MTKAKKHLGQHFLTSKQAIVDIIDAANVGAEDTVLEIGPGEGVLTDALLHTGAQVVAVETDIDMIDVLKERFHAQLSEGQLTLIHGDVLEEMHTIADAVSGIPYKMVANIPYYITGEILRRFLGEGMQPISMTLLVQKEVAERIARDTKESILSLSVKVYGTPRYVATVPARYFSPPPKVDSAILHIGHISRHHLAGVDEARFFKVVKAGFSSKRKQLVNNLSAYGGKEHVLHVLNSLGLSANVRAEDVSLSEWVSLSQTLK